MRHGRPLHIDQEWVEWLTSKNEMMLGILELRSEYLPRFSKDTTEDKAKKILKGLKDKVREQRTLLVEIYDDKIGGKEGRIRQINAAVEKIFD